MSSPTPPALSGALNSVRIDPTEADPITPGMQAVLTPGNVLNVQVREHQGERGLFVQGKFLPAALPAGVATGDKLTVQVVSNRDAVVLKILNLPTSPRAQSSRLLVDLLGELMPPRDVEVLRSLRGQPALIPLAIDLPELLQYQGRAAAGGKLRGEIAAALKEVLTRQPVITAEDLADPARTAEVLQRGTRAEAALRSVKAGVEENARLLREVADDPAQVNRAPAVLRFVTALRDQLTAILRAETPLDFERAGTDPAGVEGSVQLYLAAGHYAVMSGRPEALEQISRQIARATARDNPLVLLMQALGTFQFPEEESTSRLQQSFAEEVRELAGELHQLRNRRGGDGEIRETVKRHLERLTRLITEEKPAVREAELTAQSAHLLKHLETAAAGQEILSHLGPVLHALNEPALFMLPALLPGLLAHLELRAEPRRVTPEGEDAPGQGSPEQGFEQVQVALTLPGLGPVRVAVAHRPDEVLVGFTFASEEVAAHVRRALPKLEERLRGEGGRRLTVSVGVGQPAPVAPAWYQQVTARGVVA